MKRIRLAFTLAACLLFSAAARAQTPLTGDLKLVPPDAAVFAHVDLAKLLKSKVGDAVRNLEMPNESDADPFDKKPNDPNAPKTVKPFPQFVKQFLDATGIDLETVKSATLFIPKVKGPGDEATFVVGITLPPYDQAKLLSGLGKLNEEFKEMKQKEPGLVEFGKTGFRIAFPSDTRILVLGNQVKSIPTEYVGKPGVLAPALEAAASGKAAVFSLNFANFPEEIKGDDLPNEARPFAPLIKAELNYATFDIEGDAIKAVVRVQTDSRPKALDAERSLDALRNFARTGLAVLQAQMESEKTKNASSHSVIELVVGLQKAIKTAEIVSAENEAKLTMSLTGDTPFAAAVFGALNAARGSSVRSQTANNLKLIGLAMHNYHDAMGSFPPAAICDKNGKPLLSWRVAILPYLEQDNLYKLFKLDEPWDSEHNKKLLENYAVRTYTMPGDDAKKGQTRFRVFTGGDGKVGAAFDVKKGFKIPDFTDGTSNTALVVTAKDLVMWTKPDDLTFTNKGNPGDLLYYQNDVTPIGMCDGSVRYMKALPAETWRAIVSRNGGEVVSIP